MTASSPATTTESVDSIVSPPATSFPGLISLRDVKLKEGVSAEDFETFYREEFLPASSMNPIPGITFVVIKGERGEHVGRYMSAWVFDSIEVRDLYFPETATPSELFQAANAARNEALDPLWDKWNEYVDGPEEDVFTDYVVVE